MKFQVAITSCVIGLLLGFSRPAMAHFGMVIPSQNIVSQEKRSVDIDLSFSHPFEGSGMELRKPVGFYVVKDGQRSDLLGSLEKIILMKHQGWRTSYKVERPGIYQFIMEPQPYWEQAEDVFIIHYTKTIIAAYGADQGWDMEVGLPIEIIPLLRPFGNYVGNSFIGKVLKDGKPQPNIDVEVEFYDRTDKLEAVSDYHVTQVIQTDPNGIFMFTCPKAGWWGFAALQEAGYRLKNIDGKEKRVELGGVLWVYMDEFIKR